MSKSRTFKTQVAVTNKAAETSYYTITGDRITDVAVHLLTTGGVTVTCEATLYSSPESGDWVDITESMKSLLTGVDSAASFIDKTDIIQINNIMVRGFRVKVVTADASNTVEVTTCAQGDNIQISA